MDQATESHVPFARLADGGQGWAWAMRAASAASIVLGGMGAIVLILGIVYAGITNSIEYSLKGVFSDVPSFLTTATAFISVASDVLLILGGIGGLWLRPSARRLLIIGAILHAIGLFSSQIRIYLLISGRYRYGSAVFGYVQIFQLINSLLLSLLLPAMLLALMTRPAVKAMVSAPASRRAFEPITPS